MARQAHIPAARLTFENLFHAILLRLDSVERLNPPNMADRTLLA
jgi:hypothetical protein